MQDGDYITITAHAAGFEGACIYHTGGGGDPVTLWNSAVFGNQPDDCYPIGSAAAASSSRRAPTASGLGTATGPGAGTGPGPVLRVCVTGLE